MLALGVNIVIVFFLTPAIVKHLGTRQYGMWILVSSIVGYFGLLQLGIGTGVLRYVPLYRGKSDYKQVSEAVSTALIIYTGIGLLIFSICFFFADSISCFFDGDLYFSHLVRVIGIAAALQCPARIFDTAVRAYEQYLYINIAAVIGAIIRGAGLLLCILFSCSIVIMGWVLVGVALFSLIINIFVFRKCCHGAKVGLSYFSTLQLKSLLAFGLVVTFTAWADVLNYEIPKQAVGIMLSLEMVGMFGIACLLISYFRRVIYAVSKVFMPRFSYLHGNNSSGEIEHLFLRASKYLVIIIEN